MAREIPIASVVAATPSSPGKFIFGAAGDDADGNWTSVFQGKFYRDALGTTQPFYSSATVPAGYQLIEATSFFVRGNTTYNGKYTVYTPANAGDYPSSTFASGATSANVLEVIGNPLPANVGDSYNTGYICNISTYYLLINGESTLIVPPGVDFTNRPVEIVGKNFAGWGEVFQQNFIKAVQHYSDTTPPPNPYRGQIWYDHPKNLLKVWNSSWEVANEFGGSYRHTQSTAASSWTITHNLNAPDGFVHATFIVDTGGGVYKPIIPYDVVYNSVNQLTVTFSTTYAGKALIRL